MNEMNMVETKGKPPFFNEEWFQTLLKSLVSVEVHGIVPGHVHAHACVNAPGLSSWINENWG